MWTECRRFLGRMSDDGMAVRIEAQQHNERMSDDGVGGETNYMRTNQFRLFCSLFVQELGVNRDGKMVGEIKMVDVD